ncbi:phage tail assembly chaperone [Brevundimonas sp. A19_0]|uniref:phage tail assembly chaperone n=1 Tax=Brevundimonas sp. A19_0 TaxID=2821087 RepID=UPI001ADC0AD3|nr:phage tail assembly chaperone [Brevundimonas sp. A19_0]MBO9501099.1 phage tail assembly chaperone [Brevundimonas sp. A19_0]
MTPDWTARLEAAVRLGLSPSVFWRLSVAEWRALTRTQGQGAPLGRAEFEQLCRAWPDEGERQ